MLVDNDDEKIKFILWGEQVSLANLFRFLVESKTAKIVEDPDTTPKSVRLPTREEKILPKEVEEKNHHQGREGVGMIGMNEDPLGEARIRKGKKNHQGATQKKTSSSCW